MGHALCINFYQCAWNLSLSMLLILDQRYVFGCPWEIANIIIHHDYCTGGCGQFLCVRTSSDVMAIGSILVTSEWILCTAHSLSEYLPLCAACLQSLVLLMLTSQKPGPLKKGEKAPKAHKLVEGLSLVYMLVHMWSGYVARFFF